MHPFVQNDVKLHQQLQKRSEKTSLNRARFHILMERILHKAGVNRNGTRFSKGVQLIAYAGVIDLIMHAL